ncbi:AAA family ATPase [Modestobacter versicolor]|uniref:MinD/ParA family protein n=1 Tax=Modestobacter versicolor TaxID=429133 RepID=A0A323VB05_9ACTN|nr:AAA family ATPase [Modestobacter versicolor]MBB3676187.1 pilus assembly protein CpaE [Modestobacter versicolor]PZA21869.1 MinD/ParA family protein [Modestobacter versicolor]
MSTVLTIGADGDLVERFAEASGGDVVALGVEALADGGLLGALAAPDAPLLVVLGAEVDLDESFAVAGNVDVVAPSTSVVVVAFADPDLWMEAMRAGVRDLLSPHATPADVAAVLTRATARAEARRAVLAPVPGSAPTRRVVVVASPKGGVGKTTVATNLAVGLAAAEPGSTVLVDLDVQFGDVASALALVPQYALPEAVQGAASNDPLVLKTFLTRHPTGLQVVPGSDSPAAGDAVTPADVARLVDMLSREFRYVVVDTAPGLSDHTLTALERATDLVLLGSMDVPGVRGLRKEMDVLGELGLLPRGRHLVLNGAGSGGGLALEDVEKTLGAPLDVVLPRHDAVPLSTNTGVPLLEKGGKDPVTRGLQALVQRLAPHAAAPRGRGRRKAGAR